MQETTPEIQNFPQTTSGAPGSMHIGFLKTDRPQFKNPRSAPDQDTFLKSNTVILVLKYS